MEGIPRGFEVAVHYQPVVEPHGGAVVGVEALLRGRVDGRPAAPRELIPRLRAAGVDVAGVVVDQVARDLRTWDAWHADEIWASVNVDAVDLVEGDVAHAVGGAVAGIDPQRLLLEITEVESVRSDRVDHVLDRIRGVGARLAVDDFGVAESTLEQVEQVRPDVLKVDRSFVSTIDRPGPGRAMVEVTLALARPAGLEVIAEGVETVVQLAVLRTLGCRLVQGFLFSPAVPADRIGALLRDPEVVMPAS